jgi:hypothetical protein
MNRVAAAVSGITPAGMRRGICDISLVLFERKRMEGVAFMKQCKKSNERIYEKLSFYSCFKI